MTFVCWRVYDVGLLEGFMWFTFVGGFMTFVCWRVYDVCLLECL